VVLILSERRRPFKIAERRTGMGWGGLLEFSILDCLGDAHRADDSWLERNEMKKDKPKKRYGKKKKRKQS